MHVCMYVCMYSETTHRGLKCTVRQILPPRYIFDVMPATNENTKYMCLFIHKA